ncbi:MAG: ABC transporter ATP-binding protein [Gammaproteobacteria bacterium]|nr:ABC transporter ATP-binding protein [Gammaproteobacteria bacterium]
MATIQLRNIAHRYHGAPTDTLLDLNLTIADGEAHALLGASGTGKTTLLNLLSGLIRPTAGAIYFDDVDVTTDEPRQRNVAQVFQFPVLYESLSVRDNLSFPLITRGISRRHANARADEVAELLELEPVMRAKPGALSMFQAQKAAIGRALVRTDVSIILLDEPLTAVEPSAKWQLRRTLKQIHETQPITMIYVTHDQTEALTFADRVSVLHNGAILQSASPQTLVERPAHEHVAHFIGSPGMNLIPADYWPLEIPSDASVGFRPEWATVSADSSERSSFSSERPDSSGQQPDSSDGSEAGQPSDLVGSVTVLAVDVLGARDGQATGIVTASIKRFETERFPAQRPDTAVSDAAVSEVTSFEIKTRQRINGLRPGDRALLAVPPARRLLFRNGRLEDR